MLTAEGFAFRVYPKDHTPAHIHVWKAGAWLAVRLPTKHRPVEALRSGGMKNRDAVRAVRLTEKHAAALWDAWRKYHDQEADG